MGQSEIESLINAVAETVSAKTTKSKKHWDLAKMGVALLSAGSVIFAMGVQHANDENWKKSYDEWRPEISKTVSVHEHFIDILQGERNQAQRDRNDKAVVVNAYHNTDTK